MGQYIQIYNIYNKLIYSLFIGLPPNDAEGRFWWGDDNMYIYIYMSIYNFIILYIYIHIIITLEKGRSMNGSNTKPDQTRNQGFDWKVSNIRAKGLFTPFNFRDSTWLFFSIPGGRLDSVHINK